MTSIPTFGEQSEIWNGDAGRAWAQRQDLIDKVFKPLENLLVTALSSEHAGLVLDVGCGTGATTVAAARSLGTNGRCIGIDISEPMLEVAKARAERERANVDFIRADAQTHCFAPASIDAIISRLGVMFFDDSVAAFQNLRRATKDAAKLAFIAWRGSEHNPFMTTAERAAKPLLPNIPARDPNAPGQFAFADPNKVERILHDSGWLQIDIQPVDLPCSFLEQDLISYFTQLGPLGRVINTADEATRGRIVETLRAAFEPYVDGADVRFNAACWMVTARSS